MMITRAQAAFAASASSFVERAMRFIGNCHRLILSWFVLFSPDSCMEDCIDLTHTPYEVDLERLGILPPCAAVAGISDKSPYKHVGDNRLA